MERFRTDRINGSERRIRSRTKLGRRRVGIKPTCIFFSQIASVSRQEESARSAGGCGLCAATSASPVSRTIFAKAPTYQDHAKGRFIEKPPGRVEVLAQCFC